MQRPLISRTIGARYAPGSHQQKTIRTNTTIYQHVSTTQPAGSPPSDIGSGADSDRSGAHWPTLPMTRFASNRPIFGRPRRGSPQPHSCPIAESLKYPLPQRNSSATPDSSEVSVLANQNENPANLRQLHQLIEATFIAAELPTPEFIEKSPKAPCNQNDPLSATVRLVSARRTRVCAGRRPS
jgi:hypothetical protein